MIFEVIAGLAFGSMALLADGFHMATHAGALAISALAYRYARKHADDRRFSFGIGKLGELAAYSSALILAIIALLIGYESSLRLAEPVPIAFDEAIAVAILGLVVNILCAWLLRDSTHHHVHVHPHLDDHTLHHHGHDDHNLRAAYLHVMTDALTSVLTIAGLFCGPLLRLAMAGPGHRNAGRDRYCALVMAAPETGWGGAAGHRAGR